MDSQNSKWNYKLQNQFSTLDEELNTFDQKLKEQNRDLSDKFGNKLADINLKVNSMVKLIVLYRRK